MPKINKRFKIAVTRIYTIVFGTGCSNSTYSPQAKKPLEIKLCMLLLVLFFSGINTTLLAQACPAAATKRTTLIGCTSVVYNKKVYTVSKIVKDTVWGVQGCDSINNVVTIKIGPLTPVNNNIFIPSCTSVVYKNKTYASTSIFTDTVKSVQGCDSIYNFVYISINPLSTVTNKISLQGCAYVVYKNKTYTQTTTFTDTVKTAEGCDSVYNKVSVKISPLVPTSKFIPLASCTSITYKSKVYAQDTIFTDTVKNKQGCDSIYNQVIIDITPLRPDTRLLPLASCTSIVYKNKTYTASTNFTDTIKSVQGCDSIYNEVIINIAPLNPLHLIIVLTSCNRVVYKNKTYTASTYFTDTVKSVQGCDSTYNEVHIDIIPLPRVDENITLRGCKFVVYKNKTYTRDTYVSDTIRSIQGCDSIYLGVGIFIAPPTPVQKNTLLTGCNSVVYKNKTYTATKVIRDTVRGVQGCDSVYNTVTIKVVKLTPVNKTTALASCNSVVYKNVTYTASTLVKDTIKSAQGCDSIYNTVTITIAIVPTIKSLTLQGCSSVVYKTKTYTVSTVLSDTVKAGQGCDSIYNIVTIIVTTPVTNAVTLTGCSSLVYKNKTYTVSTILRDTVKSVQGCDSIYDVATINITPITPVRKNIKLTGCSSVVYKNKTYTASKAVKDTVRSVYGCDSVYDAVSITIIPMTVKTLNATLSGCNGVVYKNKTYTASTIIHDTLKSVQGCDSIYNITTVTVITAVTNNITLNGCNSVVYKDKTYTFSTFVSDTTRSAKGCDSIYNRVTINIAPLIPVHNSVVVTGCGSVMYKNKAYTASAKILDTTRAAQGCDSIYSAVTITVYPKPNLGGDTVLYICPGSVRSLTYIYNTNGYTKAVWKPTKTNPNAVGTGNYSLTVTNAAGCMDTVGIKVSDNIACISSAAAPVFYGAGNDDLGRGQGGLGVNLWPNPAADAARLEISGAKATVQVMITDLAGRKLWQSPNTGNGLLILPLRSLASGIYIVTVFNSTYHVSLKLVKAK